MNLKDKYQLLQGALVQTRSQLYQLQQHETAILNQIGVCEQLMTPEKKEPPEDKER
jgi:hypothetical protein